MPRRHLSVVYCSKWWRSTAPVPACRCRRGCIGAFRTALLSDTVEPALTAEVLGLPAISYLGDFMDTVDVDALHGAREAVREAVGQALARELLETYQRLQDDASYAPTPAAIGRRSLKNRVLGYLLAANGNGAADLCLAQYERQHNMTDVMAAMSLLADSEHAERDAVLADFEQRWGE